MPTICAQRWLMTAPGAPRQRADFRAGPGVDPACHAVHARPITRRAVLVP